MVNSLKVITLCKSGVDAARKVNSRSSRPESEVNFEAASGEGSAKQRMW